MKILTFLMVALFTCFAFGHTNDYDTEYRLNNRMGAVASKAQLGTLIDKTVNLVVGKYSFATQGGATGSVNLYRNLKDTSSKVVIPSKAIIKRVWVDVLTNPTSGGSATIALTTGQTAADLLAATLYSSVTGLVDGKPDGTAAKMIKATADRTVSATIATAALTAGKFNVYIEYVLGD